MVTGVYPSHLGFIYKSIVA